MDPNRIKTLDLTQRFDIYSKGSQLDRTEFLGKPGREHYPLLAYISTLFNNSDIFDIGTHLGSSALALSYNDSNHVYSFDIVRKGNLPAPQNVTYLCEDLFEPDIRSKWEDKLLNAPFIFMDIDPHEGTREFKFYEWLKEKQYKGFVIFDDIWYFKPMRDNFWYKIPDAEKVDITHMGHWSGTGIVRFTPSELWPETEVPNNWTVVTAYFDLTRMPDASESIRKRPNQHYLESARSTMALNQNLVVFCEQDYLETLRKLRPTWLHDKTKFIVMSFEDFPLTQYRNKIIQNRRDHPYNFDDRNTASYYLLCMSRYAMLKRVIEENPFGSTHFAWLNVCIERMGFKNLIELPYIFQYNRDKFSTAWIDYQPRSLIDNVPEYFRFGRCGMCSGFFTGNADYMKQFCNAMESKFLEYLEKGYGHADEQLFSAIYFEKPDLFECYFADYCQMVSNYKFMKDAQDRNVHKFFIPHSQSAHDWDACRQACLYVWDSFKHGYVDSRGGNIDSIISSYRKACQNLGISDILP
jgi:hypothetical protein